MQGYREVEESYFVQNITTKKVINDRYTRTNNYDNKRKFNDAAQRGRYKLYLMHRMLTHKIKM